MPGHESILLGLAFRPRCDGCRKWFQEHTVSIGVANPILVVEGGQRVSPCGCRNCAADLELSSLISLLLFRSLCLLLLPVELSPPMQFQHLRALAELRAADSTQSLQMFTLTAEHHDQVRWRLIQMRRCILFRGLNECTQVNKPVFFGDFGPFENDPEERVCILVTLVTTILEKDE